MLLPLIVFGSSNSMWKWLIVAFLSLMFLYILMIFLFFNMTWAQCKNCPRRRWTRIRIDRRGGKKRKGESPSQEKAQASTEIMYKMEYPYLFLSYTCCEGRFPFEQNVKLGVKSHKFQRCGSSCFLGFLVSIFFKLPSIFCILNLVLSFTLWEALLRFITSNVKFTAYWERWVSRGTTFFL